MSTRNLAFQCACVRDLLSSARSEEIRAGAEAAIKSLEWIAKGEDVLKWLIVLRREQPELFAALCELFKAFPGVHLDQVRSAA